MYVYIYIFTYVASDVWYGATEACARETGLAVKDLTTTAENGTVAWVHSALGAYQLELLRCLHALSSRPDPHRPCPL